MRSWSAWSGLVDLVVSEATAADVLPGRIRPADRRSGRSRPRPGTSPVRIEVAGGDDELCRALRRCLRGGRLSAEAVDDQEIGGIPGPRRRRRSASAAARVLTIWEVPVLEAGLGPATRVARPPDRPGDCTGRFRRSRGRRPGQGRGAVACLELPCDLDDLVDAVDRAVTMTPPESWPIPARVEPPHVLPPRVATLAAIAAWWPRRHGRIGGRCLQFPRSGK